MAKKSANGNGLDHSDQGKETHSKSHQSDQHKSPKPIRLHGCTVALWIIGSNGRPSHTGLPDSAYGWKFNLKAKVFKFKDLPRTPPILLGAPSFLHIDFSSTDILRHTRKVNIVLWGHWSRDGATTRKISVEIYPCPKRTIFTLRVWYNIGNERRNHHLFRPDRRPQ